MFASTSETFMTGAIAGFRFDAFDDVNHSVENRFRQRGQETGVPEHGFFHQRVARTDGDAVSAGNAARFADFRAAIPQHARMRIFPANGQRFVHLNVLAGLDAAPAQNALLRIVAIERVGVIHFVRLRRVVECSGCSIASCFVVLWTTQFPLLLSQTVQ